VDNGLNGNLHFFLDTGKGTLGFKADDEMFKLSFKVLQFLNEFARGGKLITVVTPGLLQIQVGKWPFSTGGAVATAPRATVVRGSISVTSPIGGSDCNLLLARAPARRIERLYVGFGCLLTGYDVLDRLDGSDTIRSVYWGNCRGF
jgi:hypothetical protein